MLYCSRFYIYLMVFKNNIVTIMVNNSDKISIVTHYVHVIGQMSYWNTHRIKTKLQCFTNHVKLLSWFCVINIFTYNITEGLAKYSWGAQHFWPCWLKDTVCSGCLETAAFGLILWIPLKMFTCKCPISINTNANIKLLIKPCPLQWPYGILFIITDWLR